MKTSIKSRPDILFFRHVILILSLLAVPAPRAFAAVEDIVGNYVGAWTNLTFGSTGGAVIEPQVNGTNATIMFDLDGYVFGYVDPPRMTLFGSLQGNTLKFATNGMPVFGDVQCTVDVISGAVSLALTNIPGGFIQQVTITGSVTNGLIKLNYTVIFPGAPSATNPAYGVIVTVLAPLLSLQPAGNNLVLHWRGASSAYTVQSRTNLSQGGWNNLVTGTTNTSYTNPISPPGILYLRVFGQ